MSTATLGATVRSVRTDSDARAFEDWLTSPRQALVVDIETAGLRWTDEVRLVQFGDTKGGWAIDPHQYPDLIYGALTSASRLCAHNASFDLPRLARFFSDGDPRPLLDTLARKTWDTRLMSHVLDSRGREAGGIGHRLKDLMVAHIDPAAADSQKILKERGRELRLNNVFADMDIWDTAYWTYGVMDCVGSALLLELFGPQIRERGLGDLTVWEHDIQRLTMAMTTVGIAVDLPLAWAWDEDLATRQESNEAIAASMGVDNIHSTRQIAAALTARKVPLTQVTDSGQTRVNKEVLVAADDDLARAVLAAKKAAKSRTMVATIIEHAEADGRVHASINSLKAVTGRMSITNPALQTLGKEDWQMRSLLVADPGEVLVAADYNQMELRTACALSQEPEWLTAFSAGEDVHQAVADRLGISRPVAKQLNFGAIYGIGKEAFAKNSGIDTVESGALLTAFRREHSVFVKWSKALKDEVTFSPDGLLHTRSGRPIRVDREYGFRACNYVTQSTARDLLCWGLTELDKAGLAGPVRLPIHDEFLASVPEDDAEEYLAALVETMTQTLDGVELSVEGTVVGKAWGDAYRPEVPDG